MEQQKMSRANAALEEMFNFSTTSKSSTSKNEEVMELPIRLLDAFAGHTFQVEDDDEFRQVADSIEHHGLATPIIVRPGKAAGRYEIVAGHRRTEIFRQQGKAKIPALIRELDDYTATVLMADTNFKARLNIRFSERARTYKLMFDVMKRQGQRIDLTSCHSGMKLNTYDEVAKLMAESARNVHRFIRLTYLIPVLLDAVDNKKLGFIPAEHVSHLTPELQEHLWDTMQRNNTSPTKAQACQLHKYFKEGILTPDVIDEVMIGKAPPEPKVSIPRSMFAPYFPSDWSEAEITQGIYRACELYAAQIVSEKKQ